MEATGTGTTLRELYQLARTTPALGDWIAAKVFGMGDRHAQLDEGMRQTLDRIAAVAESTATAVGE